MATPINRGNKMIETRSWREARMRGAHVGDHALDAISEFVHGRRRLRRVEFATDRESLSERHVPLTLAERLRVERWSKQ